MTDQMSKPKIIITEGRDRSQIAADRFPNIHWISLPLIKTEGCPIDEKENYQEYDWIIFTSRNGVNNFLNQITLPGNCKIASIGKSTSFAIEKLGYQVHFESEIPSGKFLANHIPIMENERILFVCGNLANNDIPNTITSRNAQCDKCLVYKTSEVEYERDIWLQNLDCLQGICFFSPSAVRSFYTQVGELKLEIQEDLKMYSIGNTTTAEIKDYFHMTVHSPETATFDNLIELVNKTI